MSECSGSDTAFIALPLYSLYRHVDCWLTKGLFPPRSLRYTWRRLAFRVQSYCSGGFSVVDTSRRSCSPIWVFIWWPTHEVATLRPSATFSLSQLSTLNSNEFAANLISSFRVSKPYVKTLEGESSVLLPPSVGLKLHKWEQIPPPPRLCFNFPAGLCSRAFVSAAEVKDEDIRTLGAWPNFFFFFLGREGSWCVFVILLALIGFTWIDFLSFFGRVPHHSTPDTGISKSFDHINKVWMILFVFETSSLNKRWNTCGWISGTI